MALVRIDRTDGQRRERLTGKEPADRELVRLFP